MKLIFEKSVPGRRCSILPRCDVEEVQLPQELRRQEAPALTLAEGVAMVRSLRQQGQRMKDAVRRTAEETGLSRNDLYNAALAEMES